MSRYKFVFGALLVSSLVLSAEPTAPDLGKVRAALLREVPSRPRIRTESVSTPARATAYAVDYRANGTPRQLRPLAHEPGIRSEAAATPLEAARTFLRANRALLRIDDPDRELVATSEAADDRGGRHIRFAQQWKNVPVWPAELIVHLDASGNVELVDGAHVPSPRRVSRRPVIGATDAAARAIARAATRDASAGLPELIVHARNGRRPRLAWKMTVSESLVQQWLVIVDAMNGDVLQRFNNVKTAAVTGSGVDLSGTTRALRLWQEGSTFYMLDTSKAMFDPASAPPSPQNTRGGIFVSDFLHG